jgi:hypothetical protein
MEKNLHDIDKLFHDALEPLEDKPGKQVWENIGRQLDKDQTAHFKKRYEWFKKLSVLLLLLLIGFGIYHFVSINKSGPGNNNTTGNSVNAVTNKAGKPEIITSPGVQKDLVNNDVNTVSPDHSLANDAVNKDPAHKPNENDNRVQQKNDLPDIAVNKDDKNSNPDKTASFNVLPKAVKNKPSSKTPTGILPVYIGEKPNDEKTGKGKQTVLTEKTRTRIKITNALPVESENISNTSALTTVDATPVLNKLQPLPVEKIKVKKAIGGIDPDLSSKPLPNTTAANEKNISPTKKTTQKNKPDLLNFFSVGAYYAPGLTFNNITNDQDDDHDNRNNIKSRESNAVSSTIAVTVSYKAGKHIAIQSGAALFTSKNDAGDSKVFAQKDNNGNVRYRNNSSSGFCYMLPPFSTNPAVGDSLQVSNGKNKTSYIEVPLMINYSIGKNKFIFNPGIGVSLNILTKGISSATLQSGTGKTSSISSPLQGLKKTGTSLLLTPQVQYQLTKKLAISATPYLKYALAPVNTGGTVVNTYPLNFGAGIGGVYKF